MRISEFAKGAYLNDPSTCPYCGAKREGWCLRDRGELSMTATLRDVETIWECRDCGEKWMDTYQLVGIVEA